MSEDTFSCVEARMEGLFRDATGPSFALPKSVFSNGDIGTQRTRLTRSRALLMPVYKNLR